MEPAALAAPAASLSVRPKTDLNSLSLQILDGLEQHDALSQRAATAFLDCAELSVRCGWLLADARQLLEASTGGGHWSRWLEEKGISIERAQRLRRLGTFFSRDLTDYQRRQEAGYQAAGLVRGIGPSLRQQLVNTRVKSQNQLLRLLGLKSESATQKSAKRIEQAKALPQPGRLQGLRKTDRGAVQTSVSRPEDQASQLAAGGNGQHATVVAVLHPAVPLTPTEALIDTLRQALHGLESFDFSHVTPLERKQIDRHLAPLNRFRIRPGQVAAVTGSPSARQLDELVSTLEAALHGIDLFDFDKASFPQRRAVMEPIGEIVQTYENFRSYL